MKFSKFCLVFLFTAAFLGGCASSNSSDNQIELTDYVFTMYGTGGSKICTGVMTVKNIIATDVNAPSFSGTYKITDWFVENFPAESTMGGEFTGEVNYTNGTLFVNTNPKMADANVFFNAARYSTFYQGEWNYSTFRGPTTRGELLIKKK